MANPEISDYFEKGKNKPRWMSKIALIKGAVYKMEKILRQAVFISQYAARRLVLFVQCPVRVHLDQTSGILHETYQIRTGPVLHLEVESELCHQPDSFNIPNGSPYESRSKFLDPYHPVAALDGWKSTTEQIPQLSSSQALRNSNVHFFRYEDTSDPCYP